MEKGRRQREGCPDFTAFLRDMCESCVPHTHTHRDEGGSQRSDERKFFLIFFFGAPPRTPLGLPPQTPAGALPQTPFCKFSIHRGALPAHYPYD